MNTAYAMLAPKMTTGGLKFGLKKNDIIINIHMHVWINDDLHENSNKELSNKLIWHCYQIITIKI